MPDKMRFVNNTNNALVAYLPFNISATEDVCDNEWTATGDVSLSQEIKKFGTSSVYLPNNAYLSADDILNLDADKWTFDTWCYYISGSETDTLLALGGNNAISAGGIQIFANGIGVAKTVNSWATYNVVPFPTIKNEWIHIAIVKDENLIHFFQNGIKIYTHDITNGWVHTNHFLLGSGIGRTPAVLYFDNVRFFENVALWTFNFTLPTESDYPDFIPPTTPSTIQSGSSSVTTGILDTVPSSVDGGMWLDISGDTPVPKFYYNGISYALGTIVTPSTTDFSEFLAAYLPLDTATTTDICGNSWTISGDVSIDKSIKKFGAGSFLSAGGYITANDIFDVTGDKWTFDCWIYASSVPDPSVWCHLGSNNGSVYTGVWFGQHQAVVGPLLNGDWQYRTGDIFANTLNQWEHVAMVKNGARLYFFSNGQLVERGTLPQAISGGSHFRLGFPSLHITEARFFDGVALWTSDFTPPAANDYSNSTSSSKTAGILDTVPVTVDGGSWYEVTNGVPAIWFHKGNYDYRYSYDKLRFSGDAIENLVAYLPFTSTLDDVLGNEWTVTGSPTITDGACSFDGSSYLVLNDVISLGGRDFTVDAWFKSTANQDWKTALYISHLSATNSYDLLDLTQNGSTLYVSAAWGQNFALINDFQSNVRRHIALVYSHTEGVVKAFLDGELKQTVSMTISRTAVRFELGSGFLERDNAGANFKGTLDHVRVFDGIALWTSDFTLPTANDYI